MTDPRLRLTTVIWDVLDMLTNAAPDDPPWGLRICQLTGHGTSTTYPALDRLLRAGLVDARWEETAPADRPRRRYYEITSTGREWFGAQVRAREDLRKRWLPASPRPGAAS